MTLVTINEDFSDPNAQIKSQVESEQANLLIPLIAVSVTLVMSLGVIIGLLLKNKNKKGNNLEI